MEARYYARLLGILDNFSKDFSALHLSFFSVRIVLVFFFCLYLMGCMVGPNFHTPPAPSVDTYTEKALAKKTARTNSLGSAGKAQQFVHGKDIPSQWWVLYRSPKLNHLIRTGLVNSPNLASAYAVLRQAQEALNVQIGNSLLPAFNLGLLGQRQRFSEATVGASQFGSSIFNLFNASVSVSYTLDLFGGARRQIEGLAAQIDFQQFELIAADLSLTANIVTTSVTIASLQAQIDATRELIKAQQGILRIIKKQFELGSVSGENIYAQETLVAQTIASLPPLEKSLSQAKHALSVLVGQFPTEPLPTIRLEELNLPKELPVSIPSQLVRQRPDVRAFQALLHVASANIGVATANLFPQFTLTANYGWEAITPSQLFGTSSKVWSYMGQLTQPIFHGGALLAARRQAIAAYDQAAAQYRQTVLQAFQNVADTLRALETDARELRARKAAEDAARNNFRLARNQYKLGGANYLNLLNAEQQYLTTRLARIQAEAARFADTAALFQALGGGWWHRNWCVKVNLNNQC